MSVAAPAAVVVCVNSRTTDRTYGTLREAKLDGLSTGMSWVELTTSNSINAG